MKKPTGSRFLLIKQLKKVIQESIPRLETSEQAHSLLSYIHTLNENGILSDSDYDRMVHDVAARLYQIGGDHHEE